MRLNILRAVCVDDRRVVGSPRHAAGIRDAKTVVAINNDPEARIFKNCDYVVRGNHYKVAPELISAIRRAG